MTVFSEGLRTNGSALANGPAGALPDGVAVAGGLAADGERCAVGLYRDRLQVGMGSLGGWDALGTDHR